MNTKLTLAERETHISQNADDRSVWEVYTDDVSMIHKLDKMGYEVVQKHYGGGKTYTDDVSIN